MNTNSAGMPDDLIERAPWTSAGTGLAGCSRCATVEAAAHSMLAATADTAVLGWAVLVWALAGHQHC